jgi:photosystem II stability/assembly factor-like uncharacterized protein
MPEADDGEQLQAGQLDAEDTPAASGSSPNFTQLWLQGITDLAKVRHAPGFWKPIGPAPLVIDALQALFGQGPDAGAIVDIAIHPDDPQRVFIAAGNGGVWKTSDGGTTWSPTMDFMPSLSIGAVAIDFQDHDVIYAGCGSPLLNSFSESAGLYKSIDGGQTWCVADGGLHGTVFSGKSISRMVSNDAKSLLVGTSDGLYRSVDGGANFGNNAPDFDNGKPIMEGKITSLSLDSSAPTSKALICISGLGVFRLEIDGTGPAQSLFSNPRAPAPPFDDIVLAQSVTPDGKTLFASVQTNVPGRRSSDPRTPTYRGLFKSTDAGASWQEMSDAKRAELSDAAPPGQDQTNYDVTVGVDPKHVNRVYIGFQELWVSGDGGRTFPATAQTRGKVHYDHHALRSGPPADPFTPIYVGEDGGFCRSDDGGVTWTTLNAGVGTGMIFQLDIGRGPGNNGVTYAGLQDLGTAGRRLTDWHVSVDGDGGRVAVDITNPSIVYGFSNEYFIKTSDAGVHWASSNDTPRLVGIGLPNKKGNRLIALDPNGSDPAKRVVYVTQGAELYRSADGGNNFARLTPTVNTDISSIAFVNGDPNRLWVGLVDGTIHFTSDGNLHWDVSPFTGTPGGTGHVRGIAVDPNHPERVAIAYYGFSRINPVDRTRHCYLTENNGATWTDISGTDSAGPKSNLPDLPYYSIVFDGSTNPSTLVVATANAVLASADSGKHWQVLGVGLPSVFYTSLAVDNVDTAANPRVLRAGTYGRSCFEFTRPSGARLWAMGNLAFDPAAVGQSRTLPVRLINYGDAKLHISSFTGGSVDFKLDTPLPLPDIDAGQEQVINIRFQPTQAKNLTAAFQINSNDASSPLTLNASGEALATAKGSRLAVNANLNFGEADTGDTRSLSVEVLNTGSKPLEIKSFSRVQGSTDFDLVPPFDTSAKQIVLAGDTQIFPVQFKPSSVGTRAATFKIETDASQSSALVEARGTGKSSSNTVLIIVLVVVGAAIVGGVLYYEATK